VKRKKRITFVKKCGKSKTGCENGGGLHDPEAIACLRCVNMQNHFSKGDRVSAAVSERVFSFCGVQKVGTEQDAGNLFVRCFHGQEEKLKGVRSVVIDGYKFKIDERRFSEQRLELDLTLIPPNKC